MTLESGQALGRERVVREKTSKIIAIVNST